MILLSMLLTVFTFVEFNCENLFDYIDDPQKQDEAFTPEGLYRWTPARYWGKLNRIGQTILSCGESPDGVSTIPDLVALCEVENDSVLFDLTRRSLLRNAKFEYIATDSPDQRGIDVALLYSPFSFGVIDSYSIRVAPLENMRPTRDILYVKGRTAVGDTLHVFVVHSPSRAGGEYETRQNRKIVTSRLSHSIDSIKVLSPQANIIVAGDFNDPHNGPSMKVLYDSGLVNISSQSKGMNGAGGTYKYSGEWEHIDHVLLSPPLADKAVCRIHDASFLLCKDEDYGGVQPFRNYHGIKFKNGFSDHLPIVVKIEL